MDVNSVITRRFAVGHFRENEANTVARQWMMPRSGSPAGSAISTAPDQIRWARFHLGDGRAHDGSRVLEEETLRAMQRPTVEMTGGGHVGISWFIREIDGVQILSHGGTTMGQKSSFDMVPERGFARTVLTNAWQGNLLYEDLTKWAFETYLGLVEPEPELLQVDPKDLEEYAGDYHREEYDVAISVDGDALLLTIEFTEEGRETILKELGELPPLPDPYHIAFIGPDEYTTLDGIYRGDRGTFLRNDDGSIASLDLGGRLSHKVTP